MSAIETWTEDSQNWDSQILERYMSDPLLLAVDSEITISIGHLFDEQHVGVFGGG